MKMPTYACAPSASAVHPPSSPGLTQRSIGFAKTSSKRLRKNLLRRMMDPGSSLGVTRNLKKQENTGARQSAAVQRAARSAGVSTRGTEQGAFVRLSKNGVGRASPRTHQPSSFVARRTKIPNEGGGGAVGGSGPAAARSSLRLR